MRRWNHLNAARRNSAMGNLYSSQAERFLGGIIKPPSTNPRYWRPTPELYSVGYCSDEQDTNHTLPPRNQSLRAGLGIVGGDWRTCIWKPPRTSAHFYLRNPDVKQRPCFPEFPGVNDDPCHHTPPFFPEQLLKMRKCEEIFEEQGVKTVDKEIKP